MALLINKNIFWNFFKLMAQPFVTLRWEWLLNVARISIEYLK